MLAMMKGGDSQMGTDIMPSYGQIEFLTPDKLEYILTTAPVAYIPLGTYEHHGWHLPIGFDGIKAHALCLRAAQRTGGIVTPTFFYGAGGAHANYKWSIIRPATEVRPLIKATLDALARFGFRVVVLFTGHYPRAQLRLVHRLVEEAKKLHPKVHFIGSSDQDLATPPSGYPRIGDHAAKYETSIALALNPSWVHLEQLTPGRDVSKVTLPDTPRFPLRQWNAAHPLYGIWGEDPSRTASRELGEQLVEEIVSRLVELVDAPLDTFEK